MVGVDDGIKKQCRNPHPVVVCQLSSTLIRFIFKNDVSEIISVHTNQPPCGANNTNCCDVGVSVSSCLD